MLVVLLVFFCGKANASDTAYVVDRIKVDVTAENAATAREKALAKAQKKAFQALAGRLLSEKEMLTFEMPDMQVLSSLVQDFEILEERLSHVRYVGTYRFRFRENAIRDFFSNRGIAHTDVSSKPVLILPFYQKGSRNLLWSENNPWLEAWKTAGGTRGLVPVAVPIGDLQDITDINEDKALEADWEGVDDMRKRYGAGEVMILLAVPQTDSSTGRINALHVDIYTLSENRAEYANSMEIRHRGSESNGELFARAALSVKDKLQRLWKSMTIVDPGETNEITVRVGFSGLDEWVETKSALDRIKMLDGYTIESLNPEEAYINIKFKGDETRLRLALSQKNLVLSQPQVSFNQTGFVSRRRSNPLIYELFLESSQ